MLTKLEIMDRETLVSSSSVVSLKRSTKGQALKLIRFVRCQIPCFTSIWVHVLQQYLAIIYVMRRLVL